MVFWGFSDITGESILNSLEAAYFRDVWVQENLVESFEIEHRANFSKERER